LKGADNVDRGSGVDVKTGSGGGGAKEKVAGRQHLLEIGAGALRRAAYGPKKGRNREETTKMSLKYIYVSSSSLKAKGGKQQKKNRVDGCNGSSKKTWGGTHMSAAHQHVGRQGILPAGNGALRG